MILVTAPPVGLDTTVVVGSGDALPYEGVVISVTLGPGAICRPTL